MIPVKLQPEPSDFDCKVRQKGKRWLEAHPNATTKDLPPYWREVSYELWEAYDGICAYLAIYFDFVTGASTTDHFIPKSKKQDEIYEWKNYRLSCLSANRQKNIHKVLDPFEIEEDSFHIDFLNGSVSPNPEKSASYQKRCWDTINLLGLNSYINCKKRLDDFEHYCKGEVTLMFLRKWLSPFVYEEIRRQGIEPEITLKSCEFE